MSFLIDSNAFISPYQNYYSFDLLPSFWDFMGNQIENGNLIVISKVYDEIAVNKDKEKESDRLQIWIEQFSEKKKSIKDIKIVEQYASIMKYINSCGNYKKTATAAWAGDKIADPWLIATAMAENHSIITFEVKNSGKGGEWRNIKIPDVCSEFNVKYVTLFSVLKELGFKF